ncbi:AEC family transporter|uniref:Malonate transporter n=1 Tax=Dendrosporobacter quercicolus TaxID=146817 RepID=A0A1G9T0V1_9FIRM|nr:AEC family transporter [Dendrosporobacter quercicolus]NSL48556.1 AEC family transporter [Dendrosporobacter quercicolus DSM 1736]SDM41272.1 hypothetical protein SAMN04488502_104178 [Dendrosporobacter quercicolus]
MNNVNEQFLLSLLIIALGYMVKRLAVVKETDGEGLARIIFNITLPALIITTFSRIQIDFSLIMITVISTLYCLGMTVIALVVFRREMRSTRGMLGMLLPGFNIGLFAYPLAEAVWGQAGLQYFGMFDVGNSLVIFGVCYLVAGYFSADGLKLELKSIVLRLMKSVPLLTYVLVFCMAVSGFRFPDTVLAITGILAKANMPLSLLLLGIHLSFSFNPAYWRNMVRILALRYAIGLAAGGLCFYFLPFDDMLKYTLLLGFILPVYVAAIPFALEFHYDQKFVGALANLTMLISFVLIWLIIGFMPGAQ